MASLGAGFFFAKPPRLSPNLNAAPSISPALLGFDITANVAPALIRIVLRFETIPEPDSAAPPFFS